CLQKKEGKKEASQHGGIGNPNGARLRESFLCRVPFGSTESFSYLCSVNLKAVTLWQHSITQQEN
ncbi:hypothetical protein, partial [Phocaeicola vulgatus]|uniref:hypothetical protein n=1 Tax=Phocaeicola vulgatus TaxID=821 RepID=UPI001C8842B4